MIPLLIDAARSMDAIFWQQAYGNRDSLLEGIRDGATRRSTGIRSQCTVVARDSAGGLVARPYHQVIVYMQGTEVLR